MTEHSHSYQPLAEEALRMVSSMQDWARRSVPVEHDDDGRRDQHAGDCQWCPLCQFVAVLRGERPEVSARVVEAGTAMIGAMRALLDATVEGASNAHSEGASSNPRHAADERPRESSAPRPRVQRINLSDET